MSLTRDSFFSGLFYHRWPLKALLVSLTDTRGTRVSPMLLKRSHRESSILSFSPELGILGEWYTTSLSCTYRSFHLSPAHKRKREDDRFGHRRKGRASNEIDRNRGCLIKHLYTTTLKKILLITPTLVYLSNCQTKYRYDEILKSWKRTRKHRRFIEISPDASTKRVFVPIGWPNWGCISNFHSKKNSHSV